ncbi:MAG: BlaI/MecI/CopY family transcriptional regulator [Fidelibacterota bacterium]|nr:MAG: BlaI/MecI/CopY family transcriptional regulator [Candidatus Neomarinimicrobiota bacterium]
MPKKYRELSAAEWELMDVIWKAGQPVTVRDVLETAYPQAEKAYTTVQTLLNILVDKGFLLRRKAGKANRYTPVVPREDILRGSLATMAQRMFEGSVGAMASFLVRGGKLKPDEVQELKQLLDEQGEGDQA